MKQLLTGLLLLTAFTVGACGNGNNAADNSGTQAKFIPNVDTPEGATETYARAIETGNMALVEMVALENEREKLVAQFRANFIESEKQGYTWKVEFSDSSILNETTVYTRATYIQRKNGELTGMRNEGWVVFVKIEDGTWHMSMEQSQKLAIAIAKSNQPAGNQPENRAPDGNSLPAAND